MDRPTPAPRTVDWMRLTRDQQQVSEDEERSGTAPEAPCQETGDGQNH